MSIFTYEYKLDEFDSNIRNIDMVVSIQKLLSFKVLLSIKYTHTFGNLFGYCTKCVIHTDISRVPKLWLNPIKFWASSMKVLAHMLPEVRFEHLSTSRIFLIYLKIPLFRTFSHTFNRIRHTYFSVVWILEYSISGIPKCKIDFQ